MLLITCSIIHMHIQTLSCAAIKAKKVQFCAIFKFSIILRFCA